MQQETQPTKKLINSKETVVEEALIGFCQTNPQIAILKGRQTITLKQKVQNKVTLLCGGGSGHEPAHGGFVDEKILQAAVCGGVFASPSYQQVQGAIEHIATEKGVLVIIKNYTGDVINFELASGFAKAKNINVKTLIVNDDIAFLKDINDIEAKRNARGLSGTVLIYKILGAAAYQGENLEKIHNLGTQLNNSIFSLGVSMSSCSLPGFAPTFQIQPNEIEIGLGIHGEQGKGRDEYSQVSNIVEKMIQNDFSKFVKNEEIVLLLNNLGSVTDLEMAIFAKEILAQFSGIGVKVVRLIEGRLMTSLEMQGITVTVLKLEQQTKEQVLNYLDLPVDSKHWNISTPIQTPSDSLYVGEQEENNLYTKTQKTLNPEGQKIKDIFTNIFTKLAQQEQKYNQLDSKVGDGDTGSGLARSCKASLEILPFLQFDTDLVNSVIALGDVIANSFGGTSGPLYANFLTQGVIQLKSNVGENTIQDYKNAFNAGIQGVQTLGKAQLNDRTMYDVLFQVNETFQNSEILDPKLFAQALLLSGQQSAAAVTKMLAKKGRARYLGDKVLGELDPGSELVVEWLEIIASSL